MILQALVSCYEALAAKGKLERPGWLEAKVSWGLELNADGTLRQIVPLGLPDKKGKTTVTAMKLPAMEKRTVGIKANFLCDNATYMLGIDIKDNKPRAVESFQAAAACHLELLQGVEVPLAQAICRFFQQWDAQNAETHPVVAPLLENLKTGNFVFRMNGTFAQDVLEIKAAWDRAYNDHADTPHGRCLVTGEEGPIAVLHPSIKGVVGAQSSGASLVSFHGAAYESYGRVDAQGLNAPVGERAAFAYAAALNFMLREQDYHMRLGGTTLVYWAEDAEVAYSELLAWMMGTTDTVKQEDLRGAVNNLRDGKTAVLNGIALKPDSRFYVLGLAPNASRLSVRFFLQNSFKGFAENLYAHQERLRIVRPSFDEREELSIWALLNETANPNSKDKKPPDELVGEVMRAVLMDTPYPASLFAQVQVRIRAEKDVNRGKAAMIRAYMLKNVVRAQEAHHLKEVLTVPLNDETTYMPYVLGRLFAVLEKLQIESIESNGKKLNATIRDHFFNSACSTPAMIYPTLIKSAQDHLTKSSLPKDRQKYFEIEITKLYSKVKESYPKHMSLEDQGIFQIGYYHQKQALYTKKEDRNND